MNFQLWPVVFLIPLEVYGHTVPHWKALRYGKNGSRELSCGSTSSICQGILKSDNLLHKRAFVKTQSLHTVFILVNLDFIFFQYINKWTWRISWLDYLFLHRNQFALHCHFVNCIENHIEKWQRNPKRFFLEKPLTK